MEKAKRIILAGLKRYGLSQLPGRPYDSSFSLLATPPEKKRLIIVGFNGSLADKDFTNEESVLNGYGSPCFFNVQAGTEGEWGIRHLANRLQLIPELLGFRRDHTLYTNALLMCSKNAKSIKNEVQKYPVATLDNLIEKSMLFFEEVTVPLCQPELIIAYSSGMRSHSAARFQQCDVTVIAIRHMSRFKPDVQLIK